MRVLLETARLTLRELTAADAALLDELDSDAEVMRYLNGGIATPLEVVRAEILPGFLRHYERTPGFGYWAAVERVSGEFVGWFSLRLAREAGKREAELGYRLRRSAWGHGLATEGARALMARGFAELGVERVTATTYEENAASRRVMEKAGMVIVRRFRFDPNESTGERTHIDAEGPPWDGFDLEYAISRESWLRGQNG